MPDFTTLRAATEDDVEEVLDAFTGEIDARPADLLEFFNCMLDVLGVAADDGDIPERED